MKAFNLTLHNVPHPHCEGIEMDSEAYFKCLIKYTSMTLYHPVGTCKMGPKTDSEAVVDSNLR